MRAFGGLEQLDVAGRLSFVGPCRFRGVLFDLGSFPGAVPGDGVVRGELHRLHDPQVWSVLDRYEGYDEKREDQSLFVRRRVELLAPAGRTAGVYWYNGDASESARVPSGDWAEYVQGRSNS